MNHGPVSGPPYDCAPVRIRAIDTQKAPKKNDSDGWCRLVEKARGFMVKRAMMRAVKVRKRMVLRMKKILPMVFNPVNV